MSDSPPPSGSEPVTRDALEAMVARATACLPQQGPIGVFVAQNPLQALESIPFDDAAVLAHQRGGHVAVATGAGAQVQYRLHSESLDQVVPDRRRISERIAFSDIAAQMWQGLIRDGFQSFIAHGHDFQLKLFDMRF